MIKRISAAILAFLIVIFGFCGCSGLHLKSADSLMRPPVISGVDSELKSAFEAAVASKNKSGAPSVITLLPPSSGDYRSAFILHDIDVDGEDEALVFYSMQDDQSKCHMNVLDCIGGEWVSVADFSSSGSSINFVRFVQMNANVAPAILVSQSIYENDSSKVLSVYTCTPSSDRFSVKNICTEVYTVIENTDVDSDGQLDIFIIQQDFSNNTSPQAIAKVLKMNNSGLIEELGSAKLDGGISSYVSVKTEKVNESSPMRIYVDALKGETQMITEVIYWSSAGKSLITPMFNVETQSNIITRREENLRSQDFDGDGVIEIPSQTVLPGGRRYMSPKNLYQQMYITDWIEIKSDSDFDRFESLVNARDSYIVNYSGIKNIVGSFTVYAYDSSRTLIFREYGAASESVGDELFSIVSATKEQAQEKKIDKSCYLIEGENSVIYFEPREKGISEGITADALRMYVKSFKE